MNKLRLLHIPILIAAIFMGLGFYVKVEAAKAPKQVFIFEEITLSGKSKIDRFMERYKTRLFTFMAKQPETSRQEITDGLIESVNYGFSSENFKGNKVLVGLNKKHPEQPVILSHLASSFFVLGIHPSIKEDEDRQAYYLREALNASKGCLKKQSDHGGCWISYSASLGTLALVEGIFSTLSKMKEVNESLHKAFELSQKKSFPLAPNDVSTKDFSRGALTEFYRLVPDSWIFGMFAGIRGDKEKSWKYGKGLEVKNIALANVKARAAICYGAVSENMKLIEEGKKIVAAGLKMEILHPFGAREYARLKAMHDGMDGVKGEDFDTYEDVSCKEFGNDDESQLEQKKAEEKTEEGRGKVSSLISLPTLLLS